MEYMREGYLVCGTVQSKGCTTYRHSDYKELRNGGAEKEEEWRTNRLCRDVNEQKEVSRYRSELVRRVSSLGTQLVGMGYFIPKESGEVLEGALRQIDVDVRAYNAKAQFTRLDSWWKIFEIQATDERVAGSLYDRVISLLEDVNAAVEKGDVKELRNVLASLKGLDKVLPQDTGAKVSAFIADARKAARAAVKQAKEAGDDAIIKAALKNISSDVNGVRMSCVEVADSITASLQGKQFVPDIDVRQVEAPVESETVTVTPDDIATEEEIQQVVYEPDLPDELTEEFDFAEVSSSAEDTREIE